MASVFTIDKIAGFKNIASAFVDLKSFVGRVRIHSTLKINHNKHVSGDKPFFSSLVLSFKYAQRETCYMGRAVQLLPSTGVYIGLQDIKWVCNLICQSYGICVSHVFPFIFCVNFLEWINEDVERTALKKEKTSSILELTNTRTFKPLFESK